MTSGRLAWLKWGKTDPGVRDPTSGATEIEQVPSRLEVLHVPRVERETVRTGGRGDEEVHGARSDLATRIDRVPRELTVRPRHAVIDGQGREAGLDLPQARGAGLQPCRMGRTRRLAC